jgi:hypothetical protein
MTLMYYTLTLHIQYKQTVHKRPQEIVKAYITRGESGADCLLEGNTGPFILPETRESSWVIVWVFRSRRCRRWTVDGGGRSYCEGRECIRTWAARVHPHLNCARPWCACACTAYERGLRMRVCCACARNCRCAAILGWLLVRSRGWFRTQYMTDTYS